MQSKSEELETGLTSCEARELLAKYGQNTLAAGPRFALITEILTVVASPLALILLVAALVSAGLGQVSNAIIIALMIALSAIVNFAQTYKSSQAVKSLRQQVALTAIVLRDGQWQELSRSQIVPGDLIKLKAGDLVPADARILTARDLHLNEASLTGESLPLEKYGGVDGDTVYLGSSVVSGFATCRVIATGASTSFGDIAHQLTKKAPATEFEKGTQRFGNLIMATVMFLVAFVFLVSAVLHRDALQSLLFAVALAVGLTPEFLPMIVTVTLGQGAIKMAQCNVIVKHLPAIQNLGSMDILCSDKTGTLTSGQTVVERHVDLSGAHSERVFLLAYLNSLHETGVTSGINQAIISRAAINPLDAAILRHDAPSVDSYIKLDEVPFDFERRRLSVVLQYDHKRILISKGSPENILQVASHYEHDNQVSPLTEAQIEAFGQQFASLSCQGLRVLAVAWRDIACQDVYGKDDEKELVLAGFVTFVDALQEDAGALIETLKGDGVRIMILTGDNDLVTRHVCNQVGLQAERIILGSELERMTDAALSAIVEEHSIYARLNPAQKNRVIQALKTRGHVVGFLGDGINDAPSLHAADVGISVANASDVARESAEIILLKPGLKAIHQGIMLGRKSLANVVKYLLMGTSSNFGNMFSMAFASMFLPFLPMLPTQILLNNFLYDMAQISIPTDNVDQVSLRRPQRWDISLIKNFMLAIGPIRSIFDFLTFYLLLQVLHSNEAEFHTGWFIESLATQTLVLFVIRTRGVPWKSRPSLPLVVTTVSIVTLGAILPLTPLAKLLGFCLLPTEFFVALFLMVIVYLTLVEVVKRKLFSLPNSHAI